MIQYPGYIDTSINADEIQLLETSLKLSIKSPKNFIPINYDTFYLDFYNYGTVLFPIKQTLQRYLFNKYGFFSVIYVDLPKSLSTDPYSFYVLNKVVKDKRYWVMDCRLEMLTQNISSHLLTYMVTMFRKLYKDAYGDNEYRDDYHKRTQITEYDCEQLLRNIVLVGNPREFCNLMRNLVKQEGKYIPTENDKFNLHGDDGIQKKRFKEKEETDIIDIIKELFDNIPAQTAVDFFRSKNFITS